MIYIRTENTQVVLKHYMWDHPEHGFGRTKEELEQTGYFVESVPEEPQREGYTQTLHYTAEKGFWFEYIEHGKEEEEVQGNA